MRAHGASWLLLSILFAACSATKDDVGGALRSDSGSSDTASSDDTNDLESGGDDGGLNVDSVTPVETTPGCKAIGDCDGDGYSPPADCNDNDATINPEAYDFADDGIDNDCDGTKDNPVTTCTVAPGATAAIDFGRAADLCPQRSTTKSGKVYDPLAKAEFGSVAGVFSTSSTHADAVRIVTAFGGNKARMGDTLFGLQSGPFGSKDPRGSKAYDSLPVQNACTAIPLNAEDCKTLTAGTTPVPGFGASVQDWAEVRLFIQVPSNAQAMLFDFAYFSTEFNEYWSSPFNDAFWVLVTSGKIKGANVAKDSKGLGLTVNSGFFQLCPKSPGPSGLDKVAALSSCVGVDGDATAKVFGTLKGTYFDGEGIGATNDTVSSGGKLYIYGGGSGWLTTKFGVDPGEKIVVRFIVHDTSDGILDSAAIVDNIRWEKAPPKVITGETERPPK